MTVTVIGVDARPLAQRAVETLARAELVVGWPRHFEALGDAVPPGVRTKVIDADLAASLDAVADADGVAVLLASGDPGFFGIVRAVAAEHPDLEVIPALSSVAQAFAAAGVAWDDAHVVSAHGRPPHHAVAVCRRFPKVAVLTEPSFGPAELASALAGLDRHFVVAERLGHPDERITRLPAGEAAASQWRDPNVVVVLDPSAEQPEKGWSAPQRWTPTSWALPEDEFEHRGGMITKAEVRSLSVAWLGAGLGDLVWDVGAGSGAVAVECSRLGAAVIAVERDREECVRISNNSRRHAVPVAVVDGVAPDVLHDLPDPDAVFVGGGGERLLDIVRISAERARRCVVVSLATLERVSPVLDVLRDAGLATDGSCVSASRVTELAGGHRLAAANPVFVLRGRRSWSPS